MAARNGVETVFKADNTDLLRALKQNVESFGDMRRQVDGHLDAVGASLRRVTGTFTTTFNGMQGTLRATDTRLAETSRHINALGDDADRAAAQVRNLDTALAGLARFGGLSGVATGGAASGSSGVFVTSPGGETTFVNTVTGGGAAAAAAAAAGAGAFRRPGPGPSFSSFSPTTNYFGVVGPAPSGGGAAVAAAIGSTAAGIAPAGLYRGPGGRFMNEAQMLAASGQGPILEGSLAQEGSLSAEEDAGAAFRAAQAAQSAEVRARRQAQRMASGLPDPDGPDRLGGGLLWSLGALAHLRRRGPARVGLSIPGMAINEAWEGRAVFTNPLTDVTLDPEEIAANSRRPMNMYRIPAGSPPGLVPSSADEKFWTDERYGRQRLGSGLGGMGVGALTGGAKQAEGVLKGLGGTAAIAGAGIAAGLAAGIGAVVMLKDQAQLAVDAFLESDAAQFRMDFAFEQAGLGQYTDALKEWNNERARVVPFDDDTLASAEGILARTFGTPDDLRHYTSLVADVAAVTGRDLDSVAAAFVKFRTSGSGRIFSELGIDIRGVGDDVVTADEAFQLLEERVGGAAETLGGRAAGQMEIAKNRLGEISEEIGARLAPAFIDLAEAGAGWLENLLNPAEGSGLAALQDSLDGIDFGPLEEGFSDLGVHTAETIQSMQIDLAGWLTGNKEDINDMVADFGQGLEDMKPAVTGFYEWFNWNTKNTIMLIGGIADALEWLFSPEDSRAGRNLSGGATVLPPVALNPPKGTTPGPGPKGPRMHSGGIVPGLPGTEVMTILRAGEEVATTPGGGMRTVVINTGGSRYQRALLEDVGRALSGQGLKVLVK